MTGISETTKISKKQLARLTPVTKIKISKDLLKMEKAVDVCDKTAEQAWYTKGLLMLKIRNSGKYTERAATFEDYLKTRFYITDRHGQRMMRGVEFILKLTSPEATKNTEIGRLEAPVLPKNEGQIRPLLTDLQHDGERIHVWGEVVKSGEKKFTAELVQRKVDEFKASGQVVEDVEIKLPEVEVSLAHYRSINTGENEWYTPQEYADMARDVMGGIDLDPASNHDANQIIKAATFYTKDDDGLKKQWAGNVWLNPPYSRDLMPAFVDKLKTSYMAGDVSSAILVSHNNTDTGWFHSLASVASAICFPKNRIKFYRGEEVAAPTNGQAFFYLGRDTAKFAMIFANTGFVVTPYGAST